MIPIMEQVLIPIGIEKKPVVMIRISIMMVIRPTIFALDVLFIY